MKLKTISESTIPVTDNELTNMQHHIKDALEALQTGNRAVLQSSLNDLKELAESLTRRLNPADKLEVKRSI